MLGLLVKQVALTPRDSPNRQTLIKILWHTGATTELVAERLTQAQKISTPTRVIEAIKELAPGRIDREIAQLLNQRGLVTGKGRPFTQASVNWIRWKEGIANPASPHLTGIRADGRYSTSALAKKLGVGIHTIHYWRQKGILQATQEYARGPWWHQVTPEILTTLRQKIRRVPTNPE